MHLRTYQAYSMAEALGAVKRELGTDAVILGTRTFRRRGFFWFGGRTIIEVTATTAREAAGSRGARAEGAEALPETGAVAPAQVRATAAYRQVAGRSRVEATVNGTSSESASPAAAEPDRERTRRFAQAMLERLERAPLTASSPAPTSPAVSEVPPPSPRVQQGASSTRTSPVARPVARIPRVQDASDGSETSGASVTTVSGVEGELAAIRTLVGEVLRGQQRRSVTARSLPPQLFDWYVRLIGQEMSEELADQILIDVRSELDDQLLADPEAVREAIRRRVVAFLPGCGAEGLERPPAGRDGRPFTMVLVGPTGVGKTTTVAKLAATFKLRFGQRIGLITCDTYRIAAVEQLRTYAGIIGVELRVVLTPRDMRDAMLAMRDLDVVIVDTAGRGQNDSERIAELSKMVEAAEADEVHLVLSGTASERVLMREAEAFGTIGIDRVVLTKLDEAVGFGMLVSVVHRLGKGVSFMSAGQEVPQHIEPGDPLRLADLLLKEEVVS